MEIYTITKQVPEYKTSGFLRGEIIGAAFAIDLDTKTQIAKLILYRGAELGIFVSLNLDGIEARQIQLQGETHAHRDTSQILSEAFKSLGVEFSGETSGAGLRDFANSVGAYSGNDYMVCTL